MSKAQATARAVFYLLGSVLTAAGAAWIFPPAGLITMGLLLVIDAARQPAQPAEPMTPPDETKGQP